MTSHEFAPYDVQEKKPMNSINILGGVVPSTLPQDPATPVAGSSPPLVQISDVAGRFKDLRQVAEKSTGQFDKSRQQLELAVQELKRTSDTSGRSLAFRIDPSVSGSIVTVSNLETGQVIRQIPDEVVVRVAHSIDKMKGLLFDGKL